LGTVTPEVTIARGTVTSAWCCRACRREWPRVDTEELARAQRPSSARRRTARLAGRHPRWFATL